MSVSYKCPNCAASLVFDADAQQMVCEYCGTKLSPADVVAEAKPEWKQENQENWGEGAVQYICDSCGAAVITDQNTSATFCAFCGSPTIIPERLVEGYKPSELIPFAYGKDAAVEKFFKWCRNGRMTPRDFVSKKNIEKLTGLYIPFWLFDQDMDMNFTAEGTTVHALSAGNTTTTTTSHYNVVRSRKVAWDRIPMDGATHVDDNLMEIIEPYDYKGLVNFDMKYLAGFYAEKYDLPEDKLHGRLRERVAGYARTMFGDSVKQYRTVTNIVDRSTYDRPRFAYALLPVWMLNYKYHGKTYTFAMNGQSGKIAGEPPVSRMKVFLISAGVLAASAVLFYFLGGLAL